MATRLEKDRQMIDEIDEQIAALFEKRFEVIRDIIDFKIENRLPIRDSGREEMIVMKNTNHINDPDLRKYFRKLYVNMIGLSREYQQEILDSK